MEKKQPHTVDTQVGPFSRISKSIWKRANRLKVARYVACIKNIELKV